MNVANNQLLDFFEKEIFDLDEDDVKVMLDRYSEEQIWFCLNKRLNMAASSENNVYEDSWALGRILGAYNKIQADKYVVAAIVNSSSEIKVAYFNFLSGYWDDASPDVESAKTLSGIVATALTPIFTAG